MIASSSNGRTADSDSVNLGSSPGEAANKKNPPEMVDFLLRCIRHGENQDFGSERVVGENEY